MKGLVQEGRKKQRDEKRVSKSKLYYNDKEMEQLEGDFRNAFWDKFDHPKESLEYSDDYFVTTNQIRDPIFWHYWFRFLRDEETDPKNFVKRIPKSTIEHHFNYAKSLKNTKELENSYLKDDKWSWLDVSKKRKEDIQYVFDREVDEFVNELIEEMENESE